jgi:hypothetical protein
LEHVAATNGALQSTMLMANFDAALQTAKDPVNSSAFLGCRGIIGCHRSPYPMGEPLLFDGHSFIDSRAGYAKTRISPSTVA